MAGGRQEGLINVAKRRGPTSHDVVAVVRRVTGEKRVGHAGTLDPAAEGVLPILAGRVTRLAGFFTGYPKQYRATVKLGEETSTGDDEGEVLYRRPVPGDAYGALPAVVESFVGEISQEVPAYSAVKVRGEPLYRKARRGEATALPSRRVSIYRIAIEQITPPTFTLSVECGAGTYVRALARDIGRKLGTGASLVDLTRLAVGPFVLADALPQDLLAEGVERIFAPPHFTPADRLLPEFPAVNLPPAGARDAVLGRAINAGPWLKPGTQTRLLSEAGHLLGVGVVRGGGRIQPDIVLVTPEEIK